MIISSFYTPAIILQNLTYGSRHLFVKSNKLTFKPKKKKNYRWFRFFTTYKMNLYMHYIDQTNYLPSLKAKIVLNSYPSLLSFALSILLIYVYPVEIPLKKYLITNLLVPTG